MGTVIKLPLADSETTAAIRRQVDRLQRKQNQRRELIDERIAEMETHYAARQRELDNLRAQLPENSQ